MPTVPSVDGLFYVFAAETNELTFAVPANDGFTVVHDGVNAAGGEDLNMILMKLNEPFPAPVATGPGLIKLVAGRSIFIPGGPHVVHYLCTAGAPTFSVVRRR